MLTRSASCPDRETARWTIQKVVTANEQAVHRLLRPEHPGPPHPAAWPSREEPVGRVQLEGDLMAGRGPVDAEDERRARRAPFQAKAAADRLPPHSSAKPQVRAVCLDGRALQVVSGGKHVERIPPHLRNPGKLQVSRPFSPAPGSPRTPHDASSESCLPE